MLLAALIFCRLAGAKVGEEMVAGEEIFVFDECDEADFSVSLAIGCF